MFLGCRISVLFPFWVLRSVIGGGRRDGGFKRKHETVSSLFGLNILLGSGRHHVLSGLASLSVSSLRGLV